MKIKYRLDYNNSRKLCFTTNSKSCGMVHIYDLRDVCIYIYIYTYIYIHIYRSKSLTTCATPVLSLSVCRSSLLKLGIHNILQNILLPQCLCKYWRDIQLTKHVSLIMKNRWKLPEGKNCCCSLYDGKPIMIRKIRCTFPLFKSCDTFWKIDLLAETMMLAKYFG